MTGFNHALAGIGIAVSVGNPVLVAPLALASHFVLDALPHFYLRSFGNTLRPYPKRLRWFLSIDAIITFAFVAWAFYLWPDLWPAITIGVLFAMLPDSFWPLHGKVKSLEKFFKFHQKIQWFENPWGALFEIPFTLAMVVIIYFK